MNAWKSSLISMAGFPTGNQIAARGFLRSVRLMCWYFILYPRVTVAKNLSTAICKGHKENVFHVNPLGGKYLWISNVQLPGDWKACLEMGGVRTESLAGISKESFDQASHKIDGSYAPHTVFHIGIWLVTLSSAKVSGQSFYSINLYTEKKNWPPSPFIATLAHPCLDPILVLVTGNYKCSFTDQETLSHSQRKQSQW